MEGTITYTVKLIVLGPTSVGKTSLLTRIRDNYFVDTVEPTVGSNFFTYSVKRDNIRINYEMWDTAGQEQYHALNKMYFSNSGVVLNVYDITSADSFEKMKGYLFEFLEDEGASEPIVFLIGNKLDLEASREIPKGQSLDLAQSVKGHFLEVSVKEGTGISKLLEEVTEEVLRNVPRVAIKKEGEAVSLEGSETPSGGCCGSKTK